MTEAYQNRALNLHAVGHRARRMGVESAYPQQSELQVSPDASPLAWKPALLPRSPRLSSRRRNAAPQCVPGADPGPLASPGLRPPPSHLRCDLRAKSNSPEGSPDVPRLDARLSVYARSRPESTASIGRPPHKIARGCATPRACSLPISERLRARERWVAECAPSARDEDNARPVCATRRKRPKPPEPPPPHLLH